MRFLGYEVPSPDGALPLFIGGGDRLGGEGVQMQVRSEEYPCGVLSAPSHHFVVPSPYKQGESAIRSLCPCGARISQGSCTLYSISCL